MKDLVNKVLLLNASNMDTFPVYPYAFIQVPAVARRFGIDVICQDMLGLPQKDWPEFIRQLIFYYQPDMILITLRNTDSLTATDYDRPASGDEETITYFPIEQTKNLISTIRSTSSIKIVLGGFGFSILPEELMHYLRPDFGVFGGPEGFFENYAEIQAGNFDQSVYSRMCILRGTVCQRKSGSISGYFIDHEGDPTALR
jgi:hypothetical protein